MATDLTQDTRFSFAQKVDRLVIVTNVVRNAPIDQEKKDVFSKETLRLLKLLYEKYISSSVYDESDSNDIFVVELEDDIEELEEALSV